MVMKRLFSYLRPHKRQLTVAFLLLLLATAADLAGPKMIQVFIDQYLTPRNFDSTQLWLLGGGYITLQVAAAGLTYLQLVSFNIIALKIIQQLRMDVFGKVQHLGLVFYDKTPAGSLVSRITNDTEAVKDLYVSVLSTFVQNIVFLIGVFIAMFLLDAKLAAFCLLLLPVIVGIMQAYRYFSSRVYRVLRSKLSQLNAKLNESLQGMNMIQAMRQQRRVRNEYETINQEHFAAGMQNIQLNGLLLRPAIDLLYTVTLICILYYFGVQAALAVKIGVLYAFVNYLERLFEPVNMMMMRLAQLQQAVVSAERVFQLMDEDRMAPDKEGDEAASIEDGLIEFRNVSFSYDGTTDVLRNISFTAKPGQTVALVGHTGSGKSSIINLLMRFYPEYRGGIYIDGQRLQSFTNNELRSKIGLVLQDPFLFVGDVAYNIRLHTPGISDDEVRMAAQFVQADTFIDKLPNGYAEAVGERGATFSSGQRQLLSFARTMVLHPKVLVLDEATASVDTETEEAIQAALDKMRRGRTTIAIAHRLSTIQDADLILVLHRGEIVERGSHQELLAKQGLYHKMYMLQQGAVSA